MRRLGTRLVCVTALLVTLAGLVSGSAAAAGNRKLVEGTVYDTTCLATTCQPECPPPPHCGPITAQSGAAIVCPLAQRRIIACPLASKAAAETSPPVCLPESGCFTYPVYSGEGATINVRRRGSATVIANLPVVEGHFKIRLGAGEYVLHPYLPEESCWAGEVTMLQVYPRWTGPVSTDVDVDDTCVAHPGATK